MSRNRLCMAGAMAAVFAVAQIASANEAPAPKASAAAAGLSVSPAILETRAARGASRSVTVTNSTRRRLRVTVRPRAWRQSNTGAVAARRSGSLSGVRASVSSFALPARGRRNVVVSMSSVPSRGSQYGAFEVVGRPARRRSGINVAYRLISSLRFNPTARARRIRLSAGSARRSGRTLLLAVRNRGNTIDPVGGSVSITGPGAGRTGGIPAVRILPGKRVYVRLASLRGLRRGSYRASVLLTQRGRNRVSVTRRFTIG